MADGKVGRQFVYSILDKRPKRAKAYWFVHVEVTDEPYTKEYQVDMMGTGFRCSSEPVLRIPRATRNQCLRSTNHPRFNGNKDVYQNNQPDVFIDTRREVGDFQFILIDEVVSNVTTLGKWERQIMQAKLAIKKNRYNARNMVWFRIQ